MTLALGLAACRPEPTATPDDPSARLGPPIAVDHGPSMPYEGTWLGPSLRVSFAGRWVLVEPAAPEPGQAPIELRVTIERREGDNAFALQTAIAGVMPADFLRPSDWTLLVEDGALALAMGDEPLERYERVDADPLLVGPAVIEPSELPTLVPFELAIACLEFGSSQCAGFEGTGPRGVGCREAQWAACVGHPEAFETGTSELGRALLVAAAVTALDWSRGLLAAAPAEQRAAARAVERRVVELAEALLAGGGAERLEDYVRAARDGETGERDVEANE